MIKFGHVKKRALAVAAAGHFNIRMGEFARDVELSEGTCLRWLKGDPSLSDATNKHVAAVLEKKRGLR